MSAKNIFITGASGKIGRFLIKNLISKGYKVTSLIIDGSERGDADPKYVIADISEQDRYIPHLKDIDIVVHMAAITHTNDAEKYFKVNSEGTSCLIEACRGQGVGRFIFISTRAISEEGGAYSRSKLLAEKYVRESGLQWTILRLAEVYGASGRKGIDNLLNCIDRLPAIPVIGNGRYNVCPVHISDVAYAIEKVIESNEEITMNKIYTIAGPESFTYNEFIDKILAIRRAKRVKIHVSPHIFRIFMRISALITKDSFLVMDQLPRLASEKSDDISSAMKDLSFKPAKIEDMVCKR